MFNMMRVLSYRGIVEPSERQERDLRFGPCWCSDDIAATHGSGLARVVVGPDGSPWRAPTMKCCKVFVGT